MYEDNKTHYKQNKYHCGPIIGKKKVIFLSSQEKKNWCWIYFHHFLPVVKDDHSEFQIKTERLKQKHFLLEKNTKKKQFCIKRTCEGTTSTSQNNNEDPNAPIAAHQNASITANQRATYSDM